MVKINNQEGHISKNLASSPLLICSMKNLTHKIIFIKPLKDAERQRYIPYCDFGFHQGIIKPYAERECIYRHCIHYRKLKIENDRT